VREAEAKLNARAHLLERAAEAAAQRAEKLDAEGGAASPAKPKSAKAPQKGPAKAKAGPPPAKPPVPLSRELRPAPEATSIEVEPQAAPAAESDAEREERSRSYLVRSSAPAAPVSRHQKIYDLSDQGLTREQIAKEAGVLAGEVDLILNLRPKRRGKG
jgi:hypothetical protein